MRVETLSGAARTPPPDHRQQAEFRRLQELPCLRQCGVLPDSPLAHEQHQHLPMAENFDPPVHLDHLPAAQRHDELWDTYDDIRYIRVYTDGSATRPDDQNAHERVAHPMRILMLVPLTLVNVVV